MQHGVFVKHTSDSRKVVVGDIVRFKEPAIGVTHDSNGTCPYSIMPGEKGMIMKVHAYSNENQFEIFPVIEVMIGRWLVDVRCMYFLNSTSTYDFVNVN